MDAIYQNMEGPTFIEKMLLAPAHRSGGQQSCGGCRHRRNGGTTSRTHRKRSHDFQSSFACGDQRRRALLRPGSGDQRRARAARHRRASRPLFKDIIDTAKAQPHLQDSRRTSSSSRRTTTSPSASTPYLPKTSTPMPPLARCRAIAAELSHHCEGLQTLSEWLSNGRLDIEGSAFPMCQEKITYPLSPHLNGRTRTWVISPPGRINPSETWSISGGKVFGYGQEQCLAICLPTIF